MPVLLPPAHHLQLAPPLHTLETNQKSEIVATARGHVYISREELRPQWETTTMAKTRNTDNTKCCQGAEQQVLSYIADRNTTCTITLENCLAMSTKAKHMHLPSPSNPTARHRPREMNAYVHQKTRTKMFIADLFIIAPNCKNPNVHQWDNR